jgi:hypothetical protein
MRPTGGLLSRWALGPVLAVGASACVDTDVAYPANFPPFKIDEVASEVDMSAMGDSADAPPARTVLKDALDKWQPPGPTRPARFRIVVDDNTDAITYVMFTVLLPVTIVLADFGVPMGSATCIVDLTFDNGLITYTTHQTMSYAIGVYYGRPQQHTKCVERLVKLGIVEAAAKGVPGKAP